jgi:hypothetical protein
VDDVNYFWHGINFKVKNCAVVGIAPVLIRSNGVFCATKDKTVLAFGRSPLL